MIHVQMSTWFRLWPFVVAMTVVVTMTEGCQRHGTEVQIMGSTVDARLSQIVKDKARRVVVRERAQAVLTSREKGIRDSRPIVIDAGYAVTGSHLQFDLLVYDDARDLRGIRIREQSLDPNGAITVLEEDYPVFVFWRRRLLDILDEYLLDAVPRDQEQRKDTLSWQQYAKRRQEEYATWIRKGGMAPRGGDMPAIWMSIPDRGNVQVLVAAYDEAGNQSDYIQLEESQGSVAELHMIVMMNEPSDAETSPNICVPTDIEAELQNIIQRFPSPAPERAREVLAKWKSGVRDSRPILLDAGYANNSEKIWFDTYIFDDGGDIQGLRVREEHKRADGTTITLEEDYPIFTVYEDEPTYEIYYRGFFAAVVREGLEAHDVRWRQDACRRKDEVLPDLKSTNSGRIPRYASYLVPPIWMSIPRPPDLRVFVAVYDRAGNQSQYLELQPTSRLAQVPIQVKEETQLRSMGTE